MTPEGPSSTYEDRDRDTKPENFLFEWLTFKELTDARDFLQRAAEEVDHRYAEAVPRRYPGGFYVPPIAEEHKEALQAIYGGGRNGMKDQTMEAISEMAYATDRDSETVAEARNRLARAVEAITIAEYGGGTVFDKPEYADDFAAGFAAGRVAIVTNPDAHIGDAQREYRRVSQRHGQSWVEGYTAALDIARGAINTQPARDAKALGLTESDDISEFGGAGGQVGSPKDVGKAILDAKPYRMNVATTQPDRAIEFAERHFEMAGLDLRSMIPNFAANYQKLKGKMRHSLDIPRIQMPVIEPPDIEKFADRLAKGHIDIFPPYAKGRIGGEDEKFPWQNTGMLGGKRGEEWVTLGVKDGDLRDDVLRAKVTHIPVANLKPLQGEIWYDKLVGSLLAFGIPEQGGFLTDKAIVIVSKDMYILDGHHRFGQAMLADPKLALKSLHVPLNIDFLLKLGRSYGSAIGRRSKA